MFSWIAKVQIGRTMAQAREGNREPTVRVYAKDIRFLFPGKSRWSGEVNGKEAVGEWLERIDETGVKLYPEEAIVKGFPWKQTICLRGWDALDTPTGERVYENRYVIWGRIAWGKLRDYEVYEDTQKLAELEEYLDRQAAN